MSWFPESPRLGQKSLWTEFIGICPKAWTRVEVEVVQHDHGSFFDRVIWNGQFEELPLRFRLYESDGDGIEH